MTIGEAQELSRLAELWATSRVRRALVSHGCGALHETLESTGEREREDNKNFHQYLRSLIQGSNISETRPPWASTSGEKHEQN